MEIVKARSDVADFVAYQQDIRKRLEAEVKGLQQKVRDLERGAHPHNRMLKETYERVLARKAEFLEQMVVGR